MEVKVERRGVVVPLGRGVPVPVVFGNSGGVPMSIVAVGANGV